MHLLLRLNVSGHLPGKTRFAASLTSLYFLTCWLLSLVGYGQTAVVSTTANDGPSSLRAAIGAANAYPAATPENPFLISFSVTGTIPVARPFLVITNHVTLQGPGAASLTISGGDTTRMFWLQNGTITLRDLTLANGMAQGGNGGGGGMGAGGAIFMHEGRQDPATINSYYPGTLSRGYKTQQTHENDSIFAYADRTGTWLLVIIQ